MKEQTAEKLKQIKQSFRQLMDGVTSQSMREKGVNYHLNWGVSTGHLREMADEYGKDQELAIELWKENIRECKILAIMMMPVDEMSSDLADLWMEQTPSQEIAELAAFHLYQYLDDAPMMAFEWMASEKPLYQICGFQLLACLFSKGREANERGINEFLDQAVTALQGEHLGVRHAAFACVRRFAAMGEAENTIANSALKQLGIDL
jgi:DNA alkylation repair enzyme.